MGLSGMLRDDSRVPGPWEGGRGKEEARGWRVRRNKTVEMNIILRQL